MSLVSEILDAATPSPTKLFLGCVTMLFILPRALTPSHSHRSKTPTISGIVSGGAVALAWIIGFIIYFYKRHRRERRARALGFRSHREMLDPPKKQEEFIIPPDPAVVEAGLHPGERVYNDPKVKSSELPRHARTVPAAEMEKAAAARDEPRGQRSPPGAAPAIPHSTSEPERVADQKRASHGPASTPQQPGYPPLSPRRISEEMTVPRVG